ncbi:MAG TPA: hypothetical protein VF084_09630, partial [Nitrososphaeraceae archaeon]
MKRPNLLVIISLISFICILLITGSPFKSSTNSFDNNNSIFLEVPPIQAQGEDDGGRDEFAGFIGEDDNDNGKENEEDTGQFSLESEDTEDQQTDEVEETEDQQTDEVEETEDQQTDEVEETE